MFIFGPATVTHGGTDLGDTFGGGSITFQTEYRQSITSDYDPEPVVYGGEGSFNFFKWSGVTIGSSLLLYDWGEVKITTNNCTITLYKCRIYLSEETINIGTNEQQPIKVKLTFTADSDDNLITMN